MREENEKFNVEIIDHCGIVKIWVNNKYSTVEQFMYVDKETLQLMKNLLVKLNL